MVVFYPRRWAVEAGRFREGPDGKVAEVFWDDPTGGPG